MDDLGEEDVDPARVPTVERDLDRILDKRDDFRSEVRNFLEDYSDHLETPVSDHMEGLHYHYQ